MILNPVAPYCQGAMRKVVPTGSEESEQMFLIDFGERQLCLITFTFAVISYVQIDVGRVFDDAWLVESRVSVPEVERKWLSESTTFCMIEKNNTDTQVGTSVLTTLVRRATIVFT